VYGYTQWNYFFWAIGLVQKGLLYENTHQHGSVAAVSFIIQAHQTNAPLSLSLPLSFSFPLWTTLPLSASPENIHFYQQLPFYVLKGPIGASRHLLSA
jgi:hypothetical protein